MTIQITVQGNLNSIFLVNSSCRGNYSYAIGKETNRINKRKRENQLKCMERTQSRHGTKSVSIPKSVSEAISHPFQGGGLSPSKLSFFVLL